MDVKVKDLLVTSLDTVNAFGINGGVHRFELDELQTLTIGNTQANDPLTGKGGRTLGQLKRNKAVTISGTNGMVSLGLIEANLGAAGEHVKTLVRVPDYIIADSDAATTTNTAVGTVGNEIKEIFVKDADGLVLKTLTQDATASTGKFSYDPATKKITFAAGDVDEGADLTMYYDRQVMGDVISNMSDNYSEKLEIYVDGTAEDKCKNIYRIQFKVPYADFTGNFDFAMGDSQTTQAFEATSLASACGRGGTKFWDLTVFGLNAEDAA